MWTPHDDENPPTVEIPEPQVEVEPVARVRLCGQFFSANRAKLTQRSG